MLNSAPRQTGQLRRPPTRIPTVCVVDPQADDYQDWHDSADAHGVQLRIFPSAEEALRFSRTAAIDLWVINTELPGLSGCELCGMLKAQFPTATVCLVDEQPSPQIERAAWAARANMFGCKSMHLEWFDHWLRHVRGVPCRTPAPARRAAPPPIPNSLRS